MEETRLNRYDAGQNMVQILPREQLDSSLAQRFAESVLTMPTNGELDGAALQQMETVSEKSTPTSRAWATQIKVGGALLAATLIAFGMNRAGIAGWAAWAVFASLVFGAISWVYHNDNQYSPLGVERYKALQYRKIRQAEIASNERLTLRKIDTYETTLNRVYGVNNDD